MRNLVIIAGALMSLTLPSSVAAQDFDRGLIAYIDGDYPTALREFRLAAEQGNASAQFNLGIMYENGRGVPQNYAEAARLYRLAAEQGDALAQYNLGVMYGNGQGLPQNYQLAYMWFNLAAGKGIEGAASARDWVAGNMTPEQIGRAQQLTAECFNRNYQGCAK